MKFFPDPLRAALVAAAIIARGGALLHAAEPTATGPLPEAAAAESLASDDDAADDVAPAPDAIRPRFEPTAQDVDAAIERLLASMTLAEKIGQMCQVCPDTQEMSPALAAAIRAGDVGSIINAPDRRYVSEAQRLARDESPAGIPLLVGRDVVHGYRTVFPIPLGQAASWNPELVERAAAVAASEARGMGINWTFAPMVDIGRDPRWGRIAETLGEDPVLSSALAAAMVRGFQQETNGRLRGVAAGPKHFAAYGLAEGGRDYNRVSLSLADLHNVYLPPFRAAIDAGGRSLMTTFSEVNGVPGTAHIYLLRDVLRDQWKFDGLVVSDWNSVIEMVKHGYSADAPRAAEHAVNASVDMEMVSTTFHDHLTALVEQGDVSETTLDEAVRRILRLKFALPPDDSASESSESVLSPRGLELARRLARESLVLLKNQSNVLPLDRESLARVAVIGPLADAPQSQMGCWSLDGIADDAITPLEALREALGEGAEVLYAPGAGAAFSRDRSGIAKAVEIASQADVVLMFVGEDAKLSGEARSRADITLPGAQAELVRAVAKVGKPLVMVVLAGRPLAISQECRLADAVLYAWHPGTMGGPAIADVLLGVTPPSGKLPVTFPKSVGQIPLYYAHSNTGRPSSPEYRPWIDTGGNDPQQDSQYGSHYLDSDPNPLFPFGFGLSYTTFEYKGLELEAAEVRPGQVQIVRATVTNTGNRAAIETAQLYVRDLVASIVRPVRELKGFCRVHLKPGQSKVLEFALPTDQLAFFDAFGKRTLESGRFSVWVGGDATTELSAEFSLIGTDDETPMERASVARTEDSQAPETRQTPAELSDPKRGS